ncbi:MAG: histidinol-phosphatase HisJ family protein [Lachnospiraceae bacterium]|nr:histidinol-phosphatase HisJ family protein [Lachnospiraceae bacterium]
MAIQADYHMHTHHSGDSTAPMEAMIERAIACGLKHICLTEHHDPKFVYDTPDKEGMFELDPGPYREEYLEMSSRYASRIQVCFGMELGVQPDIVPDLKAAVSAYPFDFVIASSHLCHKKDPYYPAFFEGRSSREAFEEYFVSILENIRAFDDFDVYGHLDYAVRYAPEKDRNYHYKDHADILDEILKALIDAGKGLEINTGGLRRGLSSTNPSEEILKRYRELGGEIITAASDAHEPAFIANRFAISEAILKRCGFRYYTIFYGRKPVQLPFD